MIMEDTASLVSVPMVRDRYHQAPDIDAAVVLHEGKCSVQPFMGIEDEVDRDTTISQMRLISRDSGFYQATAQHYILFDDELWKIDGKPFLWRINGRAHHVEITMRLVEG